MLKYPDLVRPYHPNFFLDGLSVLKITGCAIIGGYYAIFRQVRDSVNKKLTRATRTISPWFSFPS
jgi:hypothetical protein